MKILNCTKTISGSLTPSTKAPSAVALDSSIIQLYERIFESKAMVSKLAIYHSISLYARLCPETLSCKDLLLFKFIHSTIETDIIQLPNEGIDLIGSIEVQLGSKVTEFDEIITKLTQLKTKLSKEIWTKKSDNESTRIEGKSHVTGRGVMQTILTQNDPADHAFFNKYGVQVIFDPHQRRYDQLLNCQIEHFDAFSLIRNRVETSINKINNQVPASAKRVIFKSILKKYPNFFMVRNKQLLPTKWLRLSLYNIIENLSEMHHKLNSTKSNKVALKWLNSHYFDILPIICSTTVLNWDGLINSNCFVITLNDSEEIHKEFRGEYLGKVIDLARKKHHSYPRQYEIYKHGEKNNQIITFLEKVLHHFLLTEAEKVTLNQLIDSFVYHTINDGIKSRNNLRQLLTELDVTDISKEPILAKSPKPNQSLDS